MKNIVIRIIIIIVGVSIWETLQVGEPTIYKEIKHNKSELLESIGRLKKINRPERIIAMSDSTIANFIKTISGKISKAHYDYYYLKDYCIDYYQKNKMLSSMTLKERYEFKQNKESWNILNQGSCMFGVYVSQDFRLEGLNKIEKEILKN